MSTTFLTLTEYMNQKDPQPMPIVYLAKDEYTVIDRIVHRGVPIVKIEIFAYPEGTYINVGRSHRLFLLDSDGGYDKPSCFWLPQFESGDYKTYFEYLVLGNQKTLLTTAPQLVKYCRVEMRFCKERKKEMATYYEFEVVNEAEKIDVENLHKNAPSEKPAV